MKSRRVSFSEQAQADLFEIETWLEAQISKQTAQRYVDRLIETCTKLDLASNRGSSRDDVVAGLRVIGFERRITIAFVVDETDVLILRLFRSGKDWETAFGDD